MPRDLAIDATPAFDPARLAFFGYHPDPSIDFCIEAEMLEGWTHNIAAGLQSEWPFWGHLVRLSKFCKKHGHKLDEDARRIMPDALDVGARLKAMPRQPICLDERYNRGARYARGPAR